MKCSDAHPIFLRRQYLITFFLNPLNTLPTAQIRQLETNHDQSVEDFANAVALLFPSSGPVVFQGKAANAVADALRIYLDAEDLLSPYAGNGLSDRITTLLNKCTTALTAEEGKMKTVQQMQASGYFAAVAAPPAAAAATGETTAAPVEGAAPPTIPVVQIIIIAVVGAILIGSLLYVDYEQQQPFLDLAANIGTWIDDMHNLAQQPDPQGSELPAIPAEITTDITFDAEQLTATRFNIQLTVTQEQFIQSLANEYGLSIEEVTAMLALDPSASEAEMRKRIERYLQLRKLYPDLAANHPEWLLWAAAFDLPDSAVTILANLNNGQSTIYSKGTTYQEVAADILAAVLGNLVQQQYQRLNDLLSQARAAKKAGIPLYKAIPGWADLPPVVQQLLDGTSDQPYKYQYGNALESLIMQQFNSPQYATLFKYYDEKFGLRIKKGLPGHGQLIPDFQIAVDGQTDVLDITSMKNSPTKIKYNVDGVEINIVLPYGQ